MAKTRQPASGTPAGLVRRLLPPPAVCGFLVLLVLVFLSFRARGNVARILRVD